MAKQITRGRSQRGAEAIEFSVGFMITFPALVWMAISGMNFIRHNKVNDLARGVGLMYIKDTNFMDPKMKRIVERVAAGLELVATDGAANPANVFNQGKGLVILSKVERQGDCSGCANENTYIVTERVYIGNRSLTIDGQTAASLAGAIPDALLDGGGKTLAAARLNNTAAQATTEFHTLWSDPAPLSDGQNVYVIEAFFAAPQFGSGEFTGRGVATKVFM